MSEWLAFELGRLDEEVKCLKMRIYNLEKNMSQLSDSLDAVDASADAEIARVIATEADLQAQITALQGQSTVTQADLDKIAAIKVKLDALNPTKPAVLPAP